MPHNMQTPLQVAVVSVAGVPLAIPVSDVEHVLQRPMHMAHLPRSQSVLDGVISHQGHPVPVIDLSRWGSLRDCRINPLADSDSVANAAAAAASDPAKPRLQRVMLLRCAGKRLAMAIDDTRELLRIPATGLHRVHQDESPHEPFHSVVSPADGRAALALLDTQRLMNLAEVWIQAPHAAQPQEETTVHAAHPASDTDGDTDEAEPAGMPTTPPTSRTPLHPHPRHAAAPHALVMMGGVQCAFPAQQIGALIPLQAMPSGWRQSAHGNLLGMLSWRGREVPVLSASALLETNEADIAMTAVLVLCTAERALALPVTAFLAVQGVPVGQLNPDSARALPHAQHYVGLWAMPGAQEGGAPQARVSAEEALSSTETGTRSVARVVNTLALLQDTAISTLGVLASSSSAVEASQQGRPNRETYLLLRAGRSVAVPAKQLQEILPLSDAVEWLHDAPSVPLPGTSVTVCGHFTWRAQQIPLEDWGVQLTGKPQPRHRSQRIAVVKRNGLWCGLLMDAVEGMVPAMGGQRNWASFGSGQPRAEILTTTVQSQERSYQIIHAGEPLAA